MRRGRYEITMGTRYQVNMLVVGLHACKIKFGCTRSKLLFTRRSYDFHFRLESSPNDTPISSSKNVQLVPQFSFGCC